MRNETRQELQKLLRVFEVNRSITKTSELPLAVWAYLGAEESYKCFCKKVDEERLSNPMTLQSMKLQLSGMRTELFSRFPGNNYVMERLQ